jgi:hypothetical protein
MYKVTFPVATIIDIMPGTGSDEFWVIDTMISKCKMM